MNAAGASVFLEAAGLLAILSAVFAMVSLGGLVVAQSESDARPPRGWVVLAWTSWAVFAISLCAFAALSTVR